MDWLGDFEDREWVLEKANPSDARVLVQVTLRLTAIVVAVWASIAFAHRMGAGENQPESPDVVVFEAGQMGSRPQSGTDAESLQ